MQGLTVNENAPVRRSMPAQEEPDQARLASARMADDSHMASCLDGEINLLQDSVPGCPYAHPLQSDGDARRSCCLGGCTWVHNGLILLLYIAFLARPERFEQAQSHIALRRILLPYERHLLAQDGEIERPVDEQEDLADLASPLQVGEEQPGDKPKSNQRLHALDRDDNAL